MYYLSRQLARINAQALAAHEGRAAPDAIDRLVSEQEACLLRFDPRISGSVFLSSFGLLLLGSGAPQKLALAAQGFGFILLVVFLLSVYAALKFGTLLFELPFDLLSFGSNLIFGSGAPSDPLRDAFPEAFK